jgi:hypothetical protein
LFCASFVSDPTHNGRCADGYPYSTATYAYRRCGAEHGTTYRFPPVTRIGDIKHLLVRTEDVFPEVERTRRGRRNVAALAALGVGLFICGFALGLLWAAP